MQDMDSILRGKRVNSAGMLRFLLPFLAVAVAAFGCNSSTPPPHAKADSDKPATKHADLYDKLHSGHFQIDAALDSIEDALKEARATKPKSADVKQSLDDIMDSIDSAGNALGDEVGEEPHRDQVEKDLAKSEARRVNLCALVNDSLHDLRDARGIVDSLADSNGVGPLEPIGVKIDVAMEDLRGALEALGGKEEVEE
jgi:hypothetical protein